MPFFLRLNLNVKAYVSISHRSIFFIAIIIDFRVIEIFTACKPAVSTNLKVMSRRLQLGVHLECEYIMHICHFLFLILTNILPLNFFLKKKKDKRKE